MQLAPILVVARATALALVVSLTACSGGGGDGTVGDPPAPPSTFLVTSSNVPNGAPWQLNRPIDVEFNADVDFDTVSTSTIQIRDLQGGPVIGSFTLLDARTVRFQPRCPTLDDLSDGGLTPGRDYEVFVGGVAPGSSAPAVTNTAGFPLERSYSTSFFVPDSSDPLVLFVDSRPGPPQVRVRGLGLEPVDSTAASYVEFGGDPDAVEYLTFDAATQTGGIDSLVPLNLYSDALSRFALVLRFDQSISSDAANVSSRRIALEARYPSGDWFGVPSRVAILDNCTVDGASVRLEPLGVLPQGASLRAVVRAGFADITGDALANDVFGFAVLEIDVASPGSVDEGAGADEVLESFDVGGGDDPNSLEDTSFPSALPRAEWSGGTLAPAFGFDGTGGPGGDFDWTIESGETVFLDTSFDEITGGPGGFDSITVPVINGVVDVRHLTVRENGRIVVVGPNPCTILASGDVVVDGRISVDGGNAVGVATLNTTSQPEPGAAGRGGGGDGGTASFLTSQSTPRGGDGEGAFGIPGRGGQGGETGYGPGTSPLAPENRRGGGGGGGRLGPDVRYPWDQGVTQTTFYRCQTLIGMDGEPGFLGTLDGTGAVSQSGPPMGGALGPGPFRDATPDNDFFGTLVRADGTQVLGELTSVWAGAGGGAGGDAVQSSTFPLTPFSQMGDEKGAGGAGGAGGLMIVAIGRIEVGPEGSITADGGVGGGGENVIFFDRIGGGSGGGSGGHIVLSSASRVVVHAQANSTTVGPFYRDDPLVGTHERRPIRALGGQGGVGRGNRCGAKDATQTPWRADAIPQEAFEGNPTIPPQASDPFLACNNVVSGATPPPIGTIFGGGGDGGPGLVQIHVTDPATQLLFPNAGGTYGVDLDPTRSLVPPPVGWRSPSEPADTLVPFVGARSDAVTRWIPLGNARSNPDGSTNGLAFLFEGTDPTTGEVLRSGETVTELAPLVPWTSLETSGSTLPRVDVASATFTFDAASFDEIYVQNPALLRSFAMRIREAGGAGETVEFIVQSASIEAASGTISATVDPRGPELADFVLTLASADVELVPYHFRLRLGADLDRVPAETRVRVTFDATVADPLTLAPSANPLDALSGGEVSGFTADASDLDGELWDYVRVRVEFDLDAALDGIDVAAPRSVMEFLRLPYRF